MVEQDGVNRVRALRLGTTERKRLILLREQLVLIERLAKAGPNVKLNNQRIGRLAAIAYEARAAQDVVTMWLKIILT
jgi:hypothetical protein